MVVSSEHELHLSHLGDDIRALIASLPDDDQPLAVAFLMETHRDPEPGCWHWQGPVSTFALPLLFDGQRRYYAASVAARLWRGLPNCVPAVPRSCRDDLCVNPAHLLPGVRRTSKTAGRPPSRRAAPAIAPRRLALPRPEGNDPAIVEPLTDARVLRIQAWLEEDRLSHHAIAAVEHVSLDDVWTVARTMGTIAVQREEAPPPLPTDLPSRRKQISERVERRVVEYLESRNNWSLRDIADTVGIPWNQVKQIYEEWAHAIFYAPDGWGEALTINDPHALTVEKVRRTDHHPNALEREAMIRAMLDNGESPEAIPGLVNVSSREVQRLMRMRALERRPAMGPMPVEEVALSRRQLAALEEYFTTGRYSDEALAKIFDAPIPQIARLRRDFRGAGGLIPNRAG